MLKKIFTTVFLLVILQTYFAQNSNQISDAYLQYFKQSREIPYLHLNKTTFLKGENLWFQAYVLDQITEKLHLKTSNLYVSIYDESGKIKDQQLVRIQNGIGHGNIKIDSSFTEKAYYLRASTRWMKNFKEDNSYSQKIIILKNIAEKKEILTKDNFYDFQLFPEGGHILTNTYNRVGILIKNANGKGIEVKKGVVRNQNNEKVGFFKTNKFGIGEIIILIRDGYYVFEAFLDEENYIQTRTPEIKQKGIALNVTNDVVKNQYILKIFTNKNSLQDLANKKYSVSIHNTRRYVKDDLIFNDKNLSYSFYLDKNKLFSGINIITVFNEFNEPLLERMIFNDVKNNTITPPRITLKKDQFTNSLKVTFNNDSSEKIHLSASFLPKDSKAYNASHTLLSNSILKPFVKGDIENPSYYFSDSTSETVKNLDLLLLTQGWSKYNWNSIFNNDIKTNYNFEKGIDIVLNLNRKTNTEKTFIIESLENNFRAESALTNTTYNIDTIFFYKNSTIKFAIKNNADFFKIAPSLTFSGNTLYEEVKFNHLKELKKTIPEYTVFPFLEDGFVKLKEIEIKTKSRQEKIKEQNKQKNQLASWSSRRNNSSTFNRNVYSSPSNGYNFYYEGGFGNPWGIIEISNNGIISSVNGINQFGLGRNFSTLNSLNSDYNSTSYSLQFLDKTYRDFHELKLPIGFAKPKEYYNPKYPSTTLKSFLEYGAIWWQPNITIDPNSKLEVKIDTLNEDFFEIHLEGISNKGKFIITSKEFDLLNSVLK